MGVTMKHIEQWLALYPEATDIHLTEGGRVIVREYGGLKELEERAEKSFFDMLFHSCLSPDKRKVYEEKGACDTSFSIGENRFRLHLYRAGGKDCAALRVLPVLDRVEKDPDEKWFEKIAKLSSGLVLFSGPTGSGKSTTMARVLEGIGKEKARHIVTLEDPVEYILSAGKSLVRQREIGRDAVSFAEGVRESLRVRPRCHCRRGNAGQGNHSSGAHCGGNRASRFGYAPQRARFGSRRPHGPCISGGRTKRSAPDYFFRPSLRVGTKTLADGNEDRTAP